MKTMENKYISSKKVYFYSIFLTNNVHSLKSYLIVINLVSPIGYQEYFTLTKIVSSALLNFQVSPFLSGVSWDSLFLETEKSFHQTNKTLYENIDYLQLSFKDFKRFLISFKNVLIKQFRVLEGYYCKIAEYEKKLVFIEGQANSDPRHITSSVRQQKSNYNRKIKNIQTMYKNNILHVITCSAAINYFYKLVNEQWCLKHYSKIFNTTTVAATTVQEEQPLDLSQLDLETWTEYEALSKAIWAKLKIIFHIWAS